MSANRIDPIIVKSQLRFAVVVPGQNYPTAIISSGDDVADLIGLYSLRQAGLEKVVLRDSVGTTLYNTIDFIEAIISKNEPIKDDISSIGFIDYWAKESGDRDKLVSFIFDCGTPGIADWAVREFSAQLRDQLQIAFDSYNNNNLEKLTYIGQMISAFLSGVNTRLKYRSLASGKRRFTGFMLLLYGAILGLAALASAISSYINKLH